MNSKLTIAAILGIILTFALGATRTTYAAPPADACSLLTTAQVSAVLGVPVVSKGLGPKVCMWSQTGAKPGSTLRRVDLVILIMQGYTLAKTVAKTANAPTSMTPVRGLGDDAYYLAGASGSQYMEIRVKKGSVAFGIRVHRSRTFSVDQVKAKEKTLALDVLAKM